MNAEQKQRIAHEISDWMNAEHSIFYPATAIGDRMAALLQELVDAPEVLTATNPSQISSSAEPFGYFKAEPFGWTDCAETDDGAIALYTAPPAPSVPDGWRLVPYTPTVLMLERAEYAVNNRPPPSKYEPSATPAIIFWTAMLNYAPEAPQDADPPADVARDAERWLSQRDLELLVTFGMQADDCDADGHTLSKEQTRRLCELGVLRSVGFGRHEMTAFGDSIFGAHHLRQGISLPLQTHAEYNAARKRQGGE